MSPRCRSCVATTSVSVSRLRRRSPEILADVFAVNKVFRRSFWDDAGLSFPDRLRYEDQVALTSAFLTAGQIDVLRETVYHWRVRPRTSITQRRHEIEDLRDRLLTKQMSTDLVLDRGPSAYSTWWSTVVPVDLPLYFRSVLGCSDEYWARPRRPTSVVGAVTDPLH